VLVTGGFVSGHIKLGANGNTLRPYMLIRPEQRTKNLANPFAAKIGQGAGSYDDLQNFAAWVMDSWDSGGGNENPGEGGYHYADIDSRVGGQLINAPALGQTYQFTNASSRGLFPTETDSVTFTAVAANTAFGWAVTTPGTLRETAEPRGGVSHPRRWAHPRATLRRPRDP